MEGPIPPDIKIRDDGYIIFNPANYRQENIWLANRLHLAMISADDIAQKWFDDFLHELSLEDDRPEAVFNRHRERYLARRQEYIRYDSLYSEFFKDGDFLQDLTNRVHAMYLNGKHELDPETLVRRIYSIYFIITHLNEWRKGNFLTTAMLPTPVNQVAGMRKNTFNRMALDKVEKWFMQLANNNSSNGNPFLTPDQVQQFIDQAFISKETREKHTINMADGERTSITKLFYLYYQRCTQDYAIEASKHCKEKYVRLLTDNFTNYNYDTVFNTFNNSRTAPKRWNTTV